MAADQQTSGDAGSYRQRSRLRAYRVVLLRSNRTAEAVILMATDCEWAMTCAPDLLVYHPGEHRAKVIQVDRV